LTGDVRRIGFLPRPEEGSAPDDYGRRLGRLRWRRRFAGTRATRLDGGRPAAAIFGRGEDWIVVRDEIALPVPGGEISPLPGRVSLASARTPADAPVVHTLAEFERAPFSPVPPETPRGRRAPALFFSTADFPSDEGETVAAYVERLLSSSTPSSSPPEFAAVVFEESADERPDVARHVPAGTRRLLDVGFGSGAVALGLRRSRPGLSVTGIERRMSAAAAPAGIDRVIAGDAAGALAALLREEERFDGFLFADVLEHLEDPIGALALAHDLALPDATLVASVPNVGHLSIVRDLVRGRFDPLPAGLADAGHLRWFTRASLEDALEEAGWKTIHLEGLPGAPAPDARDFVDRAVRAFPETDPVALTTYQWVAVARADRA
jgi:2-polyprenyl-3-methyl-5-hydroxy-6-metoxy-1,4-benzoquinol methylase